MVTLLLMIIYLAFIGLGIPDPLFGTAWPAIYQEMNLSLSYANFVTITISICTMLSSLAAAHLIKKIGTGGLVALSTSLTAIALFLFSITTKFPWFILFSIPLGFGAGAIDTSLNNYVSVHYKATHMSFLHCFYGIGITLSPLLLSYALKETTWRKGYFIVFIIQACIAVLTIISLPLWKKVASRTHKQVEEINEEVIPLAEVKKNKLVRISWILFISSCGIEFVCANWGSSFLVGTKNLTPDKAASIIMFYFIGVACGRFLSGILAKKLTSLKIIFLGQGVVAIAIILLFMPLPLGFSGLALFMIGFGNGPFFPNLVYLTPSIYGKEKSASIMGTLLAAAYLGIMLIPALFGILADKLGLNLFPYFLLLLYLALLISLQLFRRVLKKRGLLIEKKHNS